MKLTTIFACLACFASTAAPAATLTVGPHSTFKTLCQYKTGALYHALDGDILQLENGVTYLESCRVTQNSLTIQAASAGQAKPVLTPGSHSLALGQGVLAWLGNDGVVDGLEITGARQNSSASGIRIDGHNFTIRNSYIHDNSDGILTVRNGIGVIDLEDSEFYNNGVGDGRSHNIYVNHADQLTVNRCHLHHARIGHELKSRAKVNVITSNWIEDGADGTASYNIDLPNGGAATVTGNTIQKGPKAANTILISYREESGNIKQRAYMWDPALPLTVAYNTFVSDQNTLNGYDGKGNSTGKSQPGPTTFVKVDNTVTLQPLVANNIFFHSLGAASVRTVVAQPFTGKLHRSNIVTPADPLFVNTAVFDYHLQTGSPAINAATSLNAVFDQIVEYDRGNVTPRTSWTDSGAFSFSILP